MRYFSDAHGIFTSPWVLAFSRYVCSMVMHTYGTQLYIVCARIRVPMSELTLQMMLLVHVDQSRSFYFAALKFTNRVASTLRVWKFSDHVTSNSNLLVTRQVLYIEQNLGMFRSEMARNRQASKKVLRSSWKVLWKCSLHKSDAITRVLLWTSIFFLFTAKLIAWLWQLRLPISVISSVLVHSSSN